jgi:hypothetical protein
MKIPGCECMFDINVDNGCIGGDWYGYCDSELCYGFCEYMGECPCDCHNSSARVSDVKE